MPRGARRMSESGFMHVIVRGIGRQLLFEEPYDYKYYLKKLEYYCMETEVKICAYCLMENHVHLLVNGDSESIILLMKKLGVSYSEFFNKKYERVGHLFQDRYISEPVETDEYLLTVFRYIIRNPQKAGICDASRYPWNSYRLYDNTPDFMDLSLIRALIGKWQQYEEFIRQDSDEQCLEYEKVRHDDMWAKEMVTKCLGVNAGTILQSYCKEDRNDALAKLKKCGLTVRQIERLTGINRNVVQRAI